MAAAKLFQLTAVSVCKKKIFKFWFRKILKLFFGAQHTCWVRSYKDASCGVASTALLPSRNRTVLDLNGEVCKNLKWLTISVYYILIKWIALLEPWVKLKGKCWICSKNSKLDNFPVDFCKDSSNGSAGVLSNMVLGSISGTTISVLALASSWFRFWSL